jgi:hypothetical protein
MEVNIISQAPKLSGEEGEYISNTKLVSEACISFVLRLASFHMICRPRCFPMLRVHALGYGKHGHIPH